MEPGFFRVTLEADNCNGEDQCVTVKSTITLNIAIYAALLKFCDGHRAEVLDILGDALLECYDILGEPNEKVDAIIDMHKAICARADE